MLCLFTDGSIHDLAETKDRVVELSYLPVSIIIVGIGDEDFGQMVHLDADSHVLLDRGGRAAARDIIQFVRFNDLREMAQVEVNEIMMAEVPDQFVDYMVMHQVVLDADPPASDDEEPETFLNNYFTTSAAQDTQRPLNTEPPSAGAFGDANQSILTNDH